ncbi:MAG: hypothetical protein E5V35_05615 [Mesorhizobium sp.]|nr:MAG: hypothetical protein E5V35_05615 [Mesorhizobium sp.]
MNASIAVRAIWDAKDGATHELQLRLAALLHWTTAALIDDMNIPSILCVDCIRHYGPTTGRRPRQDPRSVMRI